MLDKEKSFRNHFFLNCEFLLYDIMNKGIRNEYKRTIEFRVYKNRVFTCIKGRKRKLPLMFK